MNYLKLKEAEIRDIIKRALKEDIGRRDITTESAIPKTKQIKAVLLAKESCVVCGLKITELVFKLLDRKIGFTPKVKEGQRIDKGIVIASLSGRAQAILTAERVALNFLTLLCGIATKTQEFVEEIKPYKIKIMDTRKTIPGLRSLEKYAIRVGGGYNHRFRLDEMVLVKDNHLKVINLESQIPRFKDIIRKLRQNAPTKIEIEVKNLREFRDALKLNPDIIMLDNMSIRDIKKAVEIRNNLPPTTYHLKPKLEVSGGINISNVKRVASLGIDMISIGALTHSINSVDISLEVL